MGKLAVKMPSTDRKVKKGKSTLAERCVKGTWVGIFPRTGEHIIVLPSGEAIRVRTIHRFPAEDRWDSTAVDAVRALPRRPVPQRSDAEPSARTAARDQAEQGKDVEAAERCIDGCNLIVRR